MSGEPQQPAGGLQSVGRALDVLEALAARGPLGVGEVATETDLPAPTAHRLLRTLVARGYARQELGGRRYTLGARVLRLAAVSDTLLAGLAQPVLDQLAAATGETANLALLEGAYVVYVAQAQSHARMRMFTELGNRVPPHSTAVGKVLLAARPDAEAEALLARLPLTAKTPSTITDRGALRAELEAVRERGYAVDDEEEEIGVRCVAVPVPGLDEDPAAVSVSGPSSRLRREDCARLAHVLAEHAATIGAALAGGLAADRGRPAGDAAEA